MDTHSLIITETPNGRSTPTSVWDASNESDFVTRVAAASPRDDEAFELQTTEQAVAFLNQKHAQATCIITREDFLNEPVDSFDSRIIDRAVRLGWIDAPEEASEE